MTPWTLLLLLLAATAGLNRVSSSTNGRDVAALNALKDTWQHTPPSWHKSNDPCGSKWDGVHCTGDRVTDLKLSSIGLEGNLGGDIGGLTELQTLDLSSNPGLTGSVSPSIGELKKLTTLILAGCSFTGNIPEQLGNLTELSFLALNSNKFTGVIPPSLGRLSNVTWLDLADNQLTGSLPVSTLTTPGLDLLLEARHFHFNKNRLSGKIPAKLFRSEMKLIHIVFDGNQLNGEIPSTLRLVQNLELLNLANNQLTGPVPDLTEMTSLSFVDLSHNLFNASEAPTWFSTKQSLITIVMEYGALKGPVPQKLFSLPLLQQVRLKNNSFNGTLEMGESISQQLQLVDLENNQIASFLAPPSYNETLVLVGNPLCTAPQPHNGKYCQHQRSSATNYSTSLANCGSASCPPNQSLSPQSCNCACPYTGTLYFIAPNFCELSNNTPFQSLERHIWTLLNLNEGSVSLQNPFFNTSGYLQVHLEVFPSTGRYFNFSEIQRLGFVLTHRISAPPSEFGSYYFIASPYPFPEGSGETSRSSGAVIGIAVGCAVLVLLLAGVGIYAFLQKKRAESATELSIRFGNV